MSQDREHRHRVPEGGHEPGFQDAGSPSRHAADGREPRPAEKTGSGIPMKVIDRRFWARGQADAGAEGETGKDRGSGFPTVVEDLQRQLDEARARERQVRAAFHQGQQEGEAFRQRLQRDVERRVALGKAVLFRELLEVTDNLERAALASAPRQGADDLMRGVRQVLAQLQRLLAAEGVEEVPVAGLLFDPQIAEAVEVREVEAGDLDGKVIEVAQRGYRYAGQVLRPARVTVGRGPRPDGPEEGLKGL